MQLYKCLYKKKSAKKADVYLTWWCEPHLSVLLLVCWPAAVRALTCFQCASTEGKRCPAGSKQFSSLVHNACITWRHGNGTVLLQAGRPFLWDRMFFLVFSRTV